MTHKPADAGPPAEATSTRWPIAVALKETLTRGYTSANLRADLLAGIVAGIVAVPLSMALAIAVGVPPQYGLYTAIIGGGIIAVTGGARTSVSGPTAAFVVILAPIAAQYGLAGLCLATMLAGTAMIAMGIARLGGLIQFVPHPVTTGFTSGIAVVIATLQLKDFLGLTVPHIPEHYLERVTALGAALPSLSWTDLATGMVTLGILLLWPRLTRRVPAPLVALSIAALGVWGIHLGWPDFDPATINSRFHYEIGGQTFAGIPRGLPEFTWPWRLPGPKGESLVLSWDLVRSLALPALAIAMLGAIESLLCAVVADGMTGGKHDPDAELVGQGIGNILAPLFGGFAATAAIARSATSIRAGAQSPFAAVFHALFVLLAMVLLAPLLGYLPMAALAALLLVVAWNMSDAKHFVHILRVAPRSDTFVLLTCFLLTVVFDMVVSVTAGIMLSALLFMRRMSEISHTRLIAEKHPRLLAPLPPDILLYEIAGPLFFGAAEKAAGALLTAVGRAKAAILYMGGVPTMDVTALVALESAISKLQRAGALVVLVEVQPQPRALLSRAGIRREPGKLSFCRSLEEAEILVRLITPGHGAENP